MYLILIVVILLLFGGGGYYAHRTYGLPGLGGVPVTALATFGLPWPPGEFRLGHLYRKKPACRK